MTAGCEGGGSHLLDITSTGNAAVYASSSAGSGNNINNNNIGDNGLSDNNNRNSSNNSSTTITFDKPFGCGDCGKHFTRKDHLNRHRSRMAHNSSPLPPLAFSASASASSFLAANIHHTQQNPNNNNNNHNPMEPPSATSTTGSGPLPNIQSSSFNRFPCPEDGCEKSFKSNYHLRRHHQASHSNMKFECEVCGTKVSRQEHLTRHQRRLHPEKFQSPSSSAVNNNNNNNNADDETNNQQSQDGSSIASSTIQKSATSKFVCEVCSKDCFDSYKLRIHLEKSHLSSAGQSLNITKTHPCPICNKKLKSSQSLKRHMKIHDSPTQVKPPPNQSLLNATLTSNAQGLQMGGALNMNNAAILAAQKNEGGNIGERLNALANINNANTNHIITNTNNNTTNNGGTYGWSTYGAARWMGGDSTAWPLNPSASTSSSTSTPSGGPLRSKTSSTNIS